MYDGASHLDVAAHDLPQIFAEGGRAARHALQFTADAAQLDLLIAADEDVEQNGPALPELVDEKALPVAETSGARSGKAGFTQTELAREGGDAPCVLHGDGGRGNAQRTLRPGV